MNYIDLIKSSGFALLCASLLSACGSGGDSPPDPIDPPQQEQEREGQSVARMWNEVLLHAIRNDFARPTVHARNLFHVSSAMFDAWSAFNTQSSTYLFGKTVGNFSCPANTVEMPARCRIFNRPVWQQIRVPLCEE